MLLWIINPLVVITQQLLSRAETLTTLMKMEALSLQMQRFKSSVSAALIGHLYRNSSSLVPQRGMCYSIMCVGGAQLTPTAPCAYTSCSPYYDACVVRKWHTQRVLLTEVNEQCREHHRVLWSLLLAVCKIIFCAHFCRCHSSGNLFMIINYPQHRVRIGQKLSCITDVNMV